MSNIIYAPKSWNPISGCSPVSEGCANCWAKAMARRQRQEWGTVHLHEKRLEQPLHWRKPQTVAVAFMGDLFHEGVPDEFIDKVFAVMALTPQHTYLLLTKRPERMRAYLSQDWDEVGEKAARWPLIQQAVEDMGRRFDYLSANPVWPLPNVWLGVSCENQARADERIPLLLDTPAAHRWVSLEPLLGAIDLSLTGPKRDLAEQALEKLEWLAREYGSGLVCFEGNTRLEVWRQKDGTYRYQSQYVGLPAHEVNFTRAEALELLKGDADVEG